MSETPGGSGWEDRAPDPLANQQGFRPRQSRPPPPAEQVRGLIKALAFVAVLALVVVAVLVVLVIRSLNSIQ